MALLQLVSPKEGLRAVVDRSHYLLKLIILRY